MRDWCASMSLALLYHIDCIRTAQRCGASRVLGVDIDSALVAAAWKRRKYLWSLSGPCGSATSATSSRKRKRKPQDSHKQADPTESHPVPPRYTLPHFPTSMPHLYGTLSLPIPPDNPEAMFGPKSFPHNLGFRTCDWLVETRLEEFDVIVA
jgi:7SK snRNA methylphosphate capping enzyme